VAGWRVSRFVEERLRDTLTLVSRLNLPLAGIHGDYWAGNVLMEGDAVTGVVDWDEAHVDWRAYEVANATWQFCRNESSDALDLKAAREFHRHYNAAGEGLTDPEREAVGPLIRARLLYEVLFTLGISGRGGEEDWEYVSTNLNTLVNLRHVEV